MKQQRVMSPRELRRQQAELSQQTSRPITLYFGSLEEDDSCQVTVFGQRYTIPAHSPAYDEETGERIERDGTLLIRDIMGGEAFTRPPKGAAWPAADRVVQRAADIAAKILEKRQKIGVVALTGDPVKDESLKRLATARWIEYRREDAQRMHSAFNVRNQNIIRQGGRPMAMDERGMKAARFIEDLDAGVFADYLSVRSKFKFQCQEKDCARVENDGPRFIRHLVQAHKLSEAKIAEKYADAAPEEAAPETNPIVSELAAEAGAQPIKRGPGRPRNPVVTPAT